MFAHTYTHKVNFWNTSSLFLGIKNLRTGRGKWWFFTHLIEVTVGGQVNGSYVHTKASFILHLLQLEERIMQFNFLSVFDQRQVVRCNLSYSPIILPLSCFFAASFKSIHSEYIKIFQGQPIILYKGRFLWHETVVSITRLRVVFFTDSHGRGNTIQLARWSYRLMTCGKKVFKLSFTSLR